VTNDRGGVQVTGEYPIRPLRTRSPR
jgi:hypothetical protein